MMWSRVGLRRFGEWLVGVAAIKLILGTTGVKGVEAILTRLLLAEKKEVEVSSCGLLGGVTKFWMLVERAG